MSSVVKALENIQDDSSDPHEKVDYEDSQRGPSPTPSEDEAPQSQVEGSDAVSLTELEETEGTIRLDREIRIPGGQDLVPSFRYKWMGREYLLQITFTHPDYSHISPSGPGILAETPIWIVSGTPVPSPSSHPPPESLSPGASSSSSTSSTFPESPVGEVHDDKRTNDVYNYKLPITAHADLVPIYKDAIYALLSMGQITTQRRV